MYTHCITMMQIVNFKIHDRVLKQMDELVKSGPYSNRTEFIRDAIRDKVETDARMRKAYEFIREWGGKFKHMKTTDADLRRIREEVAIDLDKEFDSK